jgi:stage II sporulation protein B
VKKEGSGDGEKMDKQGNKISIKINGSERPFTTEEMDNEICAAKEEKKERLMEQAKNKEEYESNIIDLTELRKSQARPIKKKAFNDTASKYKSVFISIFTAVVIGTSFGVVMLNFLSEEKANGTLKEEAESVNAALLPPRTETKEQAADSTQPSSFSVHVVQAGVFSTAEAAGEYKKKLTDAGIPTVAIGENPTYLFIGIGIEKEALRPISEHYEQKGQKTYIKPLTLAPEADAETNKMLAASQSFYEKLISASVQLLAGQPLSDEIKGDLQNEYKQFQTVKAPSDKNAAEYKKRLENAYILFISYDQTKDAQLLPKMQEQLLEALMFYMPSKS